MSLAANQQPLGLMRPFSSEFSTINRLLDGLIIWLCLQAFCVLYQAPDLAIYKIAALLGIVLYFLVAEVRSMYRSSRLQTYTSIVGKIISTWALVAITLISIAFATKSSADFSRVTIGSWFLITPLLLAFERLCIYIILRHLRKKGGNTRSYAILGDFESAAQLLTKMNALPWTGLTHVGSYQQLNALIHKVQTEGVDYVFLSYSGNQQAEIIAAINALADSTASVYLAPNIFLSDLLGSQWITLGNMPMITINDHPFYGTQWFLKKAEDIVLGSIFFVLTLPLMIVIAIGVKLSSPGPILFKQRRYGLNGETIQVLKFRTMATQDDGAVIVQAKKDDARVTSFGKFLRRTSLDELPQFINVLQGGMSIVGPRPHAISHNEHYRKLINGYMLRHKVKPGITGWAQVNGLRGETEELYQMQARVDHDLYYINHWSPSLDIKIIFMTILNGFTGKSAY
ncbi:undecaprenyl-phosphate glucose phosphotransferase [Polynucleobacter paneuropaeus]|nr:undecaprenyl-phosphate glucose phosphotransferase [Polynucleobacter paneuropaeus]